MKHESEYNTINGLAVGADMDVDAFHVISGLDGDIYLCQPASSLLFTNS